MSVLVKDMEMPKDIEPGLVIEFADGIDGKRYARLWHYRHGGLTEWLEAIPVPPHGRLIDADKLLKESEYIVDEVVMVGRTLIPRKEIYNAPTVIEAEEAKRDCR